MFIYVSWDFLRAVPYEASTKVCRLSARSRN